MPKLQVRTLRLEPAPSQWEGASGIERTSGFLSGRHQATLPLLSPETTAPQTLCMGVGGGSVLHHLRHFKGIEASMTTSGSYPEDDAFFYALPAPSQKTK